MKGQRALVVWQTLALPSADRLEPARAMIMRGELSGKHSWTPAWERGFLAEKGEGASQDAMEDNGTCTARQFWKGCDLPVTEPESWVTVNPAYGFGISRPAINTFSCTIRRAARVSLARVDGVPEAFPHPIISTWMPTDKLEPLRVIMRGGLSGKHLPTPEWGSGFSREKDKDTSQKLVETNGTCTARQIWGEGSPTVTAPDPWVAVASAYGFSISQADDKRSSWPIKRAPHASPDSIESLPEAFPCPINSTKCVKM